MNPIIEEADSEISSNPNLSQITWGGNDARSPIRNIAPSEDSDKGDFEELSENLSSSVGGLRQWLDYKTDNPTDSRKQSTIEIMFPTIVKGFDPDSNKVKRKNSTTSSDYQRRSSLVIANISNLDSNPSIDPLSDSEIQRTDDSLDLFASHTPVEAVFSSEVDAFDVQLLEQLAETGEGQSNPEVLLLQASGNANQSGSKISFWEKIGFSDKRKQSNLLELAVEEWNKADKMWEGIADQQ